MNIKAKKLIAREFLILTCGIVVGIICFAIIERYNGSIWDKWYNLNGITIKKQKLTDSINNILVSIANDQLLPPLPKGFIPVDEYGIPIRKGFVDPLGLEAANKKKVFELKMQSKQLKYDLVNLNKRLDDIEAKTLYENNSFGINKFIKFLLTILLTLLFGFRYIYYAIRWSIKTLNTK